MNTYINFNGEIENLTFKEIKKRTNKSISWSKIQQINKHRATYENKEYVEFLDKYGLGRSVFNFNNIVEWKHLQIYPKWIKLALENGAIDKRRVNKNEFNGV